MIDATLHPSVRHRLIAVLLLSLTAIQACGGGSGGGGSGTAAATTWVHHWNGVAVDASGLDHTPVTAGEDRVFGEQLGPTRASRAMAIVHIAIFEAVNAIAGGYQSYVGLPRAHSGTSMQAAIAQAAHDTLAALYPSQAPTFDDQLAGDLASITDGQGKADGIDLGQRAAAAILAMRANDGSDRPEPVLGVDFITGDEPGMWQQDPISRDPIALGAYWGEVTPFVMESAAQFRVSPPPGIDSAEYAAAYADVKRLGGDGVVTPTERSDEQTEIGIFWAYDGTPSLCAPPRLYNQILVHLAKQEGLDAVHMARLLAVANVATADAAIAVWESKYYYSYWRPVTGIRAADDATGDPTFTPLGAPASNGTGPNFTPPFPSYPSGHGGFGGALFEVLRRFFGRDDIRFTLVSDEFNGVTKANDGTVRPLRPRTFSSFSQAEDENGQSRIYLGIHWKFDKTAAIAQGEQVGDYVFDNVFVPLTSNSEPHLIERQSAALP